MPRIGWITFCAALAACGGASENAAPAPASPTAQPAPPAPQPTASTAASSSPQAESPACTAATALPPRSAENAALVSALAVNVSTGLTLGSCAQMVARDSTGPEDLYGRATYVACKPSRICSVGEDGKRATSDDACAPLDPKIAGSGLPRFRPRRPQGGGIREERRFLVVDASARPGCATPDAAIVQYYASLLRGDDAFEAVLPPRAERRPWLTSRLEKLSRSRVQAARLDELTCTATACEARVWLDVVPKDAPPTSHSTGAIEDHLELRDGVWRMARERF